MLETLTRLMLKETDAQEAQETDASCRNDKRLKRQETDAQEIDAQRD